MRDSFYLPLIGGRRDDNIEIRSVGDIGNLGSIKVVGDALRFEAGSDLKGLPFGVPIVVAIPVEYVDAKGAVVSTVIPVRATNSPTGVDLILPGGTTARDTALLSPVAPGDLVSEPFVFETAPFQPISLDESIFVDLFNAANPKFLEAFTKTNAALVDASIAQSQAEVALSDANGALEFLQLTADARAQADALRQVLDLNQQILNDLLDEFSQATLNLTSATLAFVQAQEAIDLASANVAILSSQVVLFETVIVPEAALAFVSADSALIVNLAVFGLELPAEQHFDLPGIGPLIENLANARSNALANLEEAQASLTQLESDLNSAIFEQSEAATAFSLAAIEQAQAQAALEEFSDVDFGALEDSIAQLEAQVLVAETIAEQQEIVAANSFAVSVPISQETLEQFASDVLAKVDAQFAATIAFFEAEAAFTAAAEAYQDQIDALPDLDFSLDINELGFGLKSTFGLEFNFNRATETEERELSVALAFDFTLDVEIEGLLVIEDVFLGIDQDVPIDLDQRIERSGRVEFDGSALEGRANGALDRLAEWTDAFDFV